jgi:hypothetical protein
VEIDGVVQPAAAPRFSRTAPEATAARSGGVLADLGVTPEEIDRLQGRRSAR